MPANIKKFSDVFQKLPLSQDIMNNLGQAEVNGLRVNTRTKTMSFQIDHDGVIHDACLSELEDEMKAHFPAIEHVFIRLRGHMDEPDKHKLVARYWGHILYAVRKKSPLCAEILKKAHWRIDGENQGVLTVSVRDNSLFLFTKTGIDKLIADILDKQLNTGLRVVFCNERDEQTNDTRSSQYVEMVQKAVSKLPPPVLPPPSAEKPKKSAYQAEFIQKKRKGKRQTHLSPAINGKPVQLSAPLVQDDEICAAGQVFALDKREIKDGKLLVQFDLTDGASAVSVKFFIPKDDFKAFESVLAPGNRVILNGKVQYDEYAKELNIMAWEIAPDTSAPARMDNAAKKRVELHLHTQMSAMDGMNGITDYIKQAMAWGHKAVALTDHGVAQAYPDAMKAVNAAKNSSFKVLYGVEAYLIDDLGAVVQCPRGQTLADAFVVFDLETTGLSADKDKIIEIGAVKIENGAVTGRFNAFVNPGVLIPANITTLTGISNEMVKDARPIGAVLPEFLAFAANHVLVAHNAAFDVGFVTAAAARLGHDVDNTTLDTVSLARTLFPTLGNHKLNTIAKHLGVSLENHHRAVDDAQATADIFLQCTAILSQQGVQTLDALNAFAGGTMNTSKLKHAHAIIFALNQTGLRNLYELISISHLNHFAKRPRIPKSELVRLREGLLVGTACDAGELFTALRERKPDDYIRQLAAFYDYFEIQPLGNSMYLVRDGHVDGVQDLIDLNKKIVALGEKYQKPVVATCDVHFLNPEDEAFRRIIMTGEGYKDAGNQAPLFFRTTEEMLAEFEYLGEEKAREVVVDNTNLIADMIEKIDPIPSGKFPPHIDGAEEELSTVTMSRARELYGENLPDIVASRLTRELDAIIKNGFAVMYVIARKLVCKSLEDGYLVGSRGSVGSSLVATLSGITEVNPLSPHYICKNCQYSDFDSAFVKPFAGGSGCDMPDRECPICGAMLAKDGHDIPFETFLGFDGDKEPDIDLNFSGEYQAKAHAYTETLFGEGNVFKAGTIGTLADKTAYGYVKKYLEENGMTVRNAELNRLKTGCTGVKKTTGQHPGGLVILPKGHSIYEFCPIQRPANDASSNVTTTHFDYHSIEGRLLKLDILGHDVPTIVRMLHDITGVDPRTVDLGDKNVLSLFTSPKALGLTPEDINCQTGSLGLPEFGTGFVRGMLMETNPASFAELVRISGLSHGTDVWLGNAQALVKSGVATLKDIIPTRDDIMVYLIGKGVERKAAFKIMERVRKGKEQLADEEVKIMKAAGVPDWYIDSCNKIKYMFPKGHAVAYVMMTVRIGYYKIHYPYSFYAATFSVKTEDFDYETMCHGRECVRQEMKRIHTLGADVPAKEKARLTLLELVDEMYARGLKFVKLDVYEAEAAKFKVTPEGLMPPLCSIAGLGENVAQNIVESRKDGEFFSIEDFRNRTKTNKTVVELLKKNEILAGIPETNQLTLF